MIKTMIMRGMIMLVIKTEIIIIRMVIIITFYSIFTKSIRV